jgi:uncharacterized protein
LRWHRRNDHQRRNHPTGAPRDRVPGPAERAVLRILRGRRARLKEIDATHYDAVLDTKVAYMNFTFKVSVEVTRLSPPERIEAKVEGTPLGIVGRFMAVSTTDLVDAGSETVVKYAIDANITGKLGSIGQPVLKSKAKEMERKFAEKVRAAFAGPLPAPSPR